MGVREGGLERGREGDDKTTVAVGAGDSGMLFIVKRYSKKKKKKKERVKKRPT